MADALIIGCPFCQSSSVKTLVKPIRCTSRRCPRCARESPIRLPIRGIRIDYKKGEMAEGAADLLTGTGWLPTVLRAA